MHLFVILQPTIESFLWWLFVVITLPSKVFERNCAFWWISPPIEPVWELSTLLDAISSLWKVVGSLHWNPSSSPLVRYLAASSLRASLSKVVCWYSTFLPTLSQGDGTRDSHVAIDRFQWPLLGHYPLELYLTPHPLDSPCASHALLAMK
jgi:hypothetical protein